MGIGFSTNLRSVQLFEIWARCKKKSQKAVAYDDKRTGICSVLGCLNLDLRQTTHLRRWRREKFSDSAILESHDESFDSIEGVKEQAMRCRFCALVIVLAVGQVVIGEYKDPNYPDDPGELLEMKWNAVVSVLKNEDVDPNTKIEQVNGIVTPIFDFNLMSKLVLGRKHWPKFTPPQRVVIPMDFVMGGKKIAVQYKLRKAEIEIKVKVDKGWETRKVKRWKVYDIEIQGVSILLTYRSQFDDVLKNGTPEDLLLRLEEQTAK
jgi:phospholipid transport system substrate-binding protein